MNPFELKGRALFVFSDPGGAKPLLALADSLEEKLSDIRLISDREYSFFKEFKVNVNKPDATAFDTLQKYKSDFVLTATSYTSQIELDYIGAAKDLSIPVYSFVDHWTFIRERFNFSGKEFLPDQILVIDEKAKRIGINQGLSSKMLTVFGNPYYEYLRNWKPSISKSEFLISIGVSDSNKKIVVFAPDPLTNIGGLRKYGFDEVSATEKINIVVGNLTDGYHFIIKPHPNQQTDILKKILHPNFTLISSETDSKILIYHSDIIIGFFSNFLIEASILQKIVIRFLPELKVADPLSDLQIGTLISNSEELEISLTKY